MTPTAAPSAPEKIQVLRRKIRSYPGGILGKAIISRILERRKTRIEARHIVSEQTEISILADRIAKIIPTTNTDKLTVVQEDGHKLVDVLRRGLQFSYNIMVEELILLHAKAEADVKFLRTHGKELSPEQKAKLKEFTTSTIDAFSNFRKWLNELADEADGKTEVGSLDFAAKKFGVKRAVLFGGWFLGYRLGRIVKRTFKVEKVIEDIDEVGKLKAKDVNRLLKMNKEYTRRFGSLLKTISILTLMMIRDGFKAKKAIEEAASPKFKNWDLPKRFTGFSDELQNMLNDEKQAIESLNKGRLQVEKTLNERDALLK